MSEWNNKYLVYNNTTITEDEEIYNCLWESFARNSSLQNYTHSFQQHKGIQERISLNSKTKQNLPYNSSIELTELNSSLPKTHDSTPGPDKINYQFPIHLSANSLAILTNIFNDLWESELFL